VEIVCPRCGERGRVRVIKQKKIQNIYRYVVIDHGNTKHSVDKELMVDIIEALLNENYELKVKVGRLEEENAELREKVSKLEVEKFRLEKKAEKYDEWLEHSIIIRWNNVAELDKLKKMLEGGELYMLRVIPYKQRIDIEYADIKQL